MSLLAAQFPSTGIMTHTAGLYPVNSLLGGSNAPLALMPPTGWPAGNFNAPQQAIEMEKRPQTGLRREAREGEGTIGKTNPVTGEVQGNLL